MRIAASSHLLGRNFQFRNPPRQGCNQAECLSCVSCSVLGREMDRLVSNSVSLVTKFGNTGGGFRPESRVLRHSFFYCGAILMVDDRPKEVAIVAQGEVEPAPPIHNKGVR